MLPHVSPPPLPKLLVLNAVIMVSLQLCLPSFVGLINGLLDQKFTHNVSMAFQG